MIRTLAVALALVIPAQLLAGDVFLATEATLLICKSPSNSATPCPQEAVTWLEQVLATCRDAADQDSCVIRLQEQRRTEQQEHKKERGTPLPRVYRGGQ